MKDNTKITILIASLVLIIALILGGTFAYWQWVTSAAQNTLVNVSLTDDASMYIDFPSEDITEMYPTKDCEANGTSNWVTEITVNNGTGVDLAPLFKLKVKILDKNGNAITNVKNTGNSQPNRYYIKYAVTEEDESCQNALITGRFDQNVKTFGSSDTSGWYDSALITLKDSNDFPIVSDKVNAGVSFFAGPNKTTSHKFKVWVWLDKDYVSTNVGEIVSDSMQDAKVTVSWSENSELEQVQKSYPGEAVAIYSADDNSLRFYRDSNPSLITVGSTYNGMTVSAKYTNFENSVYTSSGDAIWSSISNDVVIVDFENYIYPKSINYWFANFIHCESIDFTKLDVSRITSMNYLGVGLGWYANTNIIGMDKWDVSNVTDMSYLFNGYYADPELDLGNWNVSNVNDMNHMFSGGEFTNININGWDTSKVTNMSYMFYSITKGLKNLDLGVLDTSSVTNMSGMFSKSSVLENIGDISGWDTSNVTDMSSMFTYASGLVSLNISEWDTSSVVNMNNMFSYTINLSSLNLNGWNVCRVTDHASFATASNNIVEPNWGMTCP